MQHFGIVRDGKTFIVQAEKQGVLKCASRRRAAKTISDANDLMRAEAVPNSHIAAPATSNDEGLSPVIENESPVRDSRGAVAS
jgi:hypothetical protein